MEGFVGECGRSGSPDVGDLAYDGADVVRLTWIGGYASGQDVRWHSGWYASAEETDVSAPNLSEEEFDDLWEFTPAEDDE